MSNKERGNILVSVVIPVKNGDYWLENTLASITRQTLFDKAEIIVIDSGSTDRSLEIIERFPIRLIKITASEFNHGETRNLGVREAKGEYVVMTVQDARPVDENWLDNLLKGFDGPQVAGVCGQQVVPHDTDKNPLAWFRPVGEPRMEKFGFSGAEDFERLTPEEKSRYCGWDNVNAAYRREVLQKVPFRKIAFAEDAQWAKDALLAGYQIAYTSYSRVYHYHFDSPSVIYTRVFEECYARYQLFGLKPVKVPLFSSMLRAAYVLFREKSLTVPKKLSWLLYNFRIRVSANRAIAEFNRYCDPEGERLRLRYVDICGKSQQALAPAEAHR